MGRISRTALMAGTLALAAPALGSAQESSGAPSTTVSEVTVTARDPAGLLQRRATSTVFGLSEPLLETPRAATAVSDTTLERYGVRGIDDLVAVSPGAFTDSYYGVAGALNLRGTLAETYFDDFKRIENRGTYPTPIGAAEAVEIVRGPPTPALGPGKVGGFLNFIPKTAHLGSGYLTGPTGEIAATVGSYGDRQVSGQLGAPLKLGGVSGGVYGYAELRDADSFYRGVHPRHQLGQLSADFDLGQGWSLSAGGMLYHSTGYVQTPGWNRVTQALIDHGTYLTGRDATLKDLNGDGRLSPGEVGPGGLIPFYFGAPLAPDPRLTLDTGLGTTTLDRRTVFVSGADFSDTTTRTGYAGLNKALGGDTLKLELFYDDLANRRFVSHGYPADYRARAAEGRLSYELKRDLGGVRTDTLIGAGVRTQTGVQKESFNGGYLSLDRRDLSVGPTPTDVFADPFSDLSVPWETDIRSRWRDAGLFTQTKLDWRGLSLTAGGRYDNYRVAARDQGTLVFGAGPGRTYTAGKGDWTWNASLSWHAPFGLMPYLTYASAAALEIGQAGGIAPQLIAQGDWLSASSLREAGIKARLYKDVLTGSLAAYRQTRTQLGQNNAVTGTVGKGVELELRWLASRRLSFTFAGDLQRTVVKGPDQSFVIVPPGAIGVAPQDAYGGAIGSLMSLFRPGDYTNSLVPGATASLYGVYTTARHPWGRAGATLGATYVSDTRSTIPGSFVLPAYTKVNGSAFVERGPWRLSANVDNLLDARYFTPVADVYANVAVLPGVGRSWRLTVRRAF